MFTSDDKKLANKVMANIKGVNEVREYIEAYNVITFYTQDENITISTGCIICLFSTYKELCDEWLNTGISENDKECFRDYKDQINKERDRKEYYDYKKEIWFVVVA